VKGSSEMIGQFGQGDGLRGGLHGEDCRRLESVPWANSEFPGYAGQKAVPLGPK
jgi:hypothetical protein